MFSCSGESEFNLVTRCRPEPDEPEVAGQLFDEFVSEEGTTKNVKAFSSEMTIVEN